MKSSAIIKAIFLASLTAQTRGSAITPASPSPARHQSAPATIDAAPILESRTFGNIPFLLNPPVQPRCKLQPMWTDGDPRHYLAYPLNDKDIDYFVQNWSGMHSLGFALMDSNGSLLLQRRDFNELGGDRIVILTSKHHGYHDIVCSACDCDDVDSETWRFDGKHYQKAQALHFRSENHFIENTPTAVVAYWYCDIFACPQCMWHTLRLDHAYPQK